MFAKLSLILCLFVSLSFQAHAQDLSEEIQETSNDGTIIIETQPDNTKSYKERRGKHGALFSFFSESFDPRSYQSGFEDGGMIGDIIQNNTVQLTGVELGYKFNVGAGSLAALFSYAQGGTNGVNVSGTTALSFTRQSLSLNAAADAVFDEPWIVPYGQVSLNLFNSHEEQIISGQQESADATTGMMIGYKYGLLFQLDWFESLFDKSSKAERLASSGLENTYVDIYYATYMADSSAGEEVAADQIPPVNLESEGQIGVGLKLEF